MNRDEAIAVIRKEYLCVDRDCDIERSCGKCDLMMPSKKPILEAYKVAIKALEQEPCEDAISRQAVFNIIEKEQFKGDAIAEIEKLPPVTPKQRTGHWTWLRPDVVQCDDCQYIHTILDDSEDGREINYCPSCGRKMEEQS